MSKKLLIIVLGAFILIGLGSGIITIAYAEVVKEVIQVSPTKPIISLLDLVLPEPTMYDNLSRLDRYADRHNLSGYFNLYTLNTPGFTNIIVSKGVKGYLDTKKSSTKVVSDKPLTEKEFVEQWLVIQKSDFYKHPGYKFIGIGFDTVDFIGSRKTCYSDDTCSIHTILQGITKTKHSHKSSIKVKHSIGLTKSWHYIH
jgi:hypothetical protein